MTRANLLPRPKSFIRIFGLTIERDYLLQALTGLATVVIVAVVGCGVEEFRLFRFAEAANTRELMLADRAPERSAAKRLALDVARYQEFAREADAFRQSGPLAALAVAQIGNAVPHAVWLDSLERDSAGYALEGGSRSVDLLSETILSLGNALPQSTASLLTIDNHTDALDAVRFRAHITTPNIFLATEPQ